MTRPIMFWSALAAYLWLVALTIGFGAAYPNYSHVTQYISELGAHGAPQGALVSWAGFAPIGVLLMVFAVAGARTAPRSVLRTLGFVGLLLFGLSYFGAAFYRCEFECRPAADSPTQSVHTALALLGYVGGPFGLMLLAVAARSWPKARWLSPLALICALISATAFLTLLLNAAPEVGLVQRVLEGAVGVWVLACAFALRKA